MRFFHLSDLHIGKQLQTYDLGEQQRQVLDQIVERAKEYQPQAILISGDIYDKAAPSGEAYSIFDEFLIKLSQLQPKVSVFIIAGNHDNPKRLAFGRLFMEEKQIYVETTPPRSQEEYLRKVTLQDEYGEVDIYLLPFVRPVDIRNLGEEYQELRTYDEAVSAFIKRQEIDYGRRNILLSHQFYVSDNKQEEIERRESESVMIAVGGIDQVMLSHVKDFDYVALGHIHTAQRVSKNCEHVRYCGTPMKYSISESNDDKVILMGEIKEKGEQVDITYIPIALNPDVRVERGMLQDFLDRGQHSEDYIHVILEDQEPQYNPKGRLQEYFPNLLSVEYKKRSSKEYSLEFSSDTSKRSPQELFMDFYQEMNQRPLTSDEEQALVEILTKLSEEVAE